MRRLESEHELEAEYRDFEPGLPRIDLVLGVALSVILGAGGLFGYGIMPQAAEPALQEDVAIAVPVENNSTVGDFVVTKGLDASLCHVEVESTFVLDALDDVRMLRVIGCVEQMDSSLVELNWIFKRTAVAPAL